MTSRKKKMKIPHKDDSQERSVKLKAKLFTGTSTLLERESLTVKGLQKLAKSMGLQGYSSLRKDELISLVESAIEEEERVSQEYLEEAKKRKRAKPSEPNLIVDYLSGPHILYHFKGSITSSSGKQVRVGSRSSKTSGEGSNEEDSKKDIYLFGEIHSSPGCENALRWGKIPPASRYMLIDKYIQKLLENDPTRQIDLYLEVSLFTDPELTEFPEEILGIDWFAESFSDCLFYDKSRCPWPNLRIHAIDVRKPFTGGKYTDPFINFIESLITGEKILPIQFPYFRELLGVSSFEELRTYLIEKIVSSPLIEKEIRRSTLGINGVLNLLSYPIVWRNIEKNLYLFGETEEKKIFKKLRKSLKEIINDEAGVYYTRESILDVKYYIIQIGSIFVDVYTICRIFKKFKTGDEPRNVIVYEGALHTERLKNFLLLLGFALVKAKHSNDEYQGCLSMSGVKQPLFSD
jgi:hypothetical protein